MFGEVELRLKTLRALTILSSLLRDRLALVFLSRVERIAPIANSDPPYAIAHADGPASFQMPK